MDCSQCSFYSLFSLLSEIMKLKGMSDGATKQSIGQKKSTALPVLNFLDPPLGLVGGCVRSFLLLFLIPSHLPSLFILPNYVVVCMTVLRANGIGVFKY